MTATSNASKRSGRGKGAPKDAIPPDEPLSADDHGEQGEQEEVVVEEMSELEVQQMMERLDREKAAASMPATVAPETVVAVEAPAIHALDLAEVNSKIVVTEEGAFLATPAGVTLLEKSDPASRLPRDARIRKVGDGEFLSTQMSATEVYPDRTDTTALGAIRAFVEHFHPHGLQS